MPVWPFTRRRKELSELVDLSEFPAPDRKTYAIGDIHGRLDKLDALLRRIAEDCGKSSHDLVFLGDYVDRGPDSAGVLARLRDLTLDKPESVTCLLGNHDRMMLEFLSSPNTSSRSWLSIGGQDTLLSYGVTQASGNSLSKKITDVSWKLRAAVGDETEAWLHDLPLSWVSGDLVAVHAQTDPEINMADQTEQTLLWARPPKEPKPRRDGRWVVHGHTVFPKPRIKGGHVAIDTGAWRDGPLTAAVFDGEPIRFLTSG